MAEQNKQTKAPEHPKVSNSKLNSLRAAVLGANDGIVSVSSIILGVAGATNSHTAILAAGFAGLVAGALSMAVGEYVSVSSQRDTEQAYIVAEKWHLEHRGDEEFADLAKTYEEKGLTPETARLVAQELTAKNAIKAHLDAEFGINEEDLSSPIGAAWASLVAFTIGGIVPLGTVLLVNHSLRLIATVASVIIALVITGYLSATVGSAPRPRAIARVLLGGIIAMVVTYTVGHIFGSIVG